MARRVLLFLTITLLCTFTFVRAFDEDEIFESIGKKIKKTAKSKFSNLKDKFDDDDDVFESLAEKAKDSVNSKYDKLKNKFDDDDNDDDDNAFEYLHDKAKKKIKSKLESLNNKLEDDKDKIEMEGDEGKYDQSNVANIKTEAECSGKIKMKCGGHKGGKGCIKKRCLIPIRCRFRFCDYRHILYVGKSDVPLTAAICSRYGERIGSIDQTGEAYRAYYFLPPRRISKWKPYGLKQSFSPSFFKSYTKRGKNASGVGHEVAQQNQADYLHKKRWILPLKAYQVWNKKTGGWVEKYGKNPFVDCIAFRTRTKKFPC